MAGLSLPAPRGAAPWALSRGRLIDILSDTLADLADLRFPLATDDAAQARHLCASLTGYIHDHMLPRLNDADVPAIAVVGGSTGAGKSTLVNSLLGAEVSAAGVLRPTTRTPVLVCHPEDEDALAGHPVSEVCTRVSSTDIPPGLALIDASDLDSVQESNRALASRLLEAADLWLFVTTAARYGDLTPWVTLEAAVGHDTPVAVVLNRAPATVLPEVRRDLLARLADVGLSEAPFFVVPDVGPHEGLLEGNAIDDLRQWLHLLAGRHRAAGLMRRTDKNLWVRLREDLNTVAAALDTQDDAGRRLETVSDDLVAEVSEALHHRCEDASYGQGAPASRWVSLASAGGPLASLAQQRPLRRGWRGRHTRERVHALDLVASDVCDAVDVQVSAALDDLMSRVDECWTHAGVGEAVNRMREEAPQGTWVSEQWRERTAARVADRGDAVPGLGEDGAVPLILAAAGGVEGCVQAARRVGYEHEVEAARQDLAELGCEVLRRAVPQGSACALSPDGALASALRLRAGELAPLVRPGDE